MTKKIVFGVVLGALVAVAAVPSASASCIPAKSATTFSTVTSYWIPSAAGGTVVGQAWMLGAPGTYSTTGCPPFLTLDAGGISMNLDLGACGAGCPANGSTLATLAQHVKPDGTVELLLDTIVETPASSVNFDYATQGNHNLVPLVHPRVVGSARVGNLINFTATIDAVNSGLYGPNAANAVVGYKLVTAQSAGDPGRDAAAFTNVLATIAASGGSTGVSGPLSVDCTDITRDQWVAVQLSLENGTVLSQVVSQPTRINCNPALANPKYNKVAPKKIIAPGNVAN
jgi:hypothetical protein